MATLKFTPGEVIGNERGDKRIVLMNREEGKHVDVLYLDCEKERGYFYNPTRAMVSETQLLKTYPNRLGKLDIIVFEKLMEDMHKIMQIHMKAMAEVEDLLKNEIYSLEKFK